MKLLLITKNEMDTLNIQFLLKNHISFAYTYEDFLSKLHDNIDTVGFTSKAIQTMSTSSKFINLLNGIKVLYDYKLVYFTSDETDLVSKYCNSVQKAHLAPSLVECSEFDIKTYLNTDEVKILKRSKDTGLSSGELPTLLNTVERNPDSLLSNPKLLKDLIYLTSQVARENSGLSREVSVLLSQKIHLLQLSTSIGEENERLTDSLRTLEHINHTNYESLCAYKIRYDEYRNTLNTIINHGIANINDDLYSSIKVENSTYPVTVLYLKSVTHLKYTSSYINSLLKILLDRRLISKYIRILPKNSTSKLKKYKNHVNTTYGLDAKTYATYSKFVHLGNPHQILDFMLSNVVPVDVIIILDETALDNQYCYGDTVVKYFVANSDSDIREYELDEVSAIVNEKSQDSPCLQLPKYDVYDTIATEPKLTTVYHEKLPLTSSILSSLLEVIER